MGLVKVNNVSFVAGRETSQGVLTPPTTYFEIEPNQGGIGTFGATITTVERNPISKNRQQREGTIVDLEAAADITFDLTKGHFELFAEAYGFAGFTYLHANGADLPPLRSGAAGFGNNLIVDTAASFGHDTITTGITQGYLVFARGFTNAANNGLHEVDAAATPTQTLVTSVLVVESPGNQDNATLETAGFRPATDDITWTDATRTLGSTVLDFTTLGLTLNQKLRVGGAVAANQFDNGVLIGDIESIATNAIVLKSPTGTLVGADGISTTKRVDLLSGYFLRNVATDAPEFGEIFHRFQQTLPNLFTGQPDINGYKQVTGGAANTLAISIPLTAKATMQTGFAGLDSPAASNTFLLASDTPLKLVQSRPFNTSSEVGRLRLLASDLTGLTSCIKSATININNQVETEKCLGVLGASNTNIGNLIVTVDLQIQFVDADSDAAVRNNETVSFDTLLRNDDGGIGITVPSAKLGGGDLEYPENASVLQNLTVTAFADPVLDTSFGITVFPFLPVTPLV